MMSFNPMTRSVLALSIVAVLSGCSTLPRDGPSGRAVERGASSIDSQGFYQIVDLDYGSSELIKTAPPQFFGTLVGSSVEGSPGIGVGDTLAVSIFEPSGNLFGSGTSSTSVRSGTQQLPALVVDSSGSVTIPFAPRPVRVQGLSTPEAGAAIRRALLGRVGNPQVVVSIAENASNAVTVLGEVRQPGRAPLSTNASRILDVIAAAGGVARPVEDVVVNVQRNGQTFSAPLAAVTTTFEENVRLQAGDQINLLYQPRKFSTFGAVGAVAEVQMESGPVTLAGAVSKVGGLDTNSANARSVLVFRFERPEVAQALGVTQAATVRGVPIVYRLNLEDASGLFTAGNFLIQPGDIVYVPRSGLSELRKFFEAVQSVTRIVYDVSVTSTLQN
jgi:polysaccharide biosynthesis/export protein